MVLHCFSAGKAPAATDKTPFRGVGGSKCKPAPSIVSTASLARAANTSHPSPRTTPSTCLTRAFRLSRVMSPAGQNKEKEGHACSPQELCRAQRQATFTSCGSESKGVLCRKPVGGTAPETTARTQLQRRDITCFGVQEEKREPDEVRGNLCKASDNQVLEVALSLSSRPPAPATENAARGGDGGHVCEGVHFAPESYSEDACILQHTDAHGPTLTKRGKELSETRAGGGGGDKYGCLIA
jgi:hypothetical protein